MSDAQNRAGSGGDAHTRIARARSHPVRAQIYGILKQEASSPSDIARRLSRQLSNISYHVRALQSLGLIEVVSKDAVRGTIKTTYRAVPEQELFAAPGEELSPGLDALVEVRLDEAGRAEVVEAGREFLRRVDAAEQKTEARSARGRSERFATVVSLLSYAWG